MINRRFATLILLLLTVTILVSCKGQAKNEVYLDMSDRIAVLEEENKQLKEENRLSLNQNESLQAEINRLDEQTSESLKVDGNSSDDLKENDYEFIVSCLKGQSEIICEFLNNNGVPFYRVKEETETEYIKICSDWFENNNDNHDIKLLTLGYVMKTDFSNRLVVEGLIYDPSVYTYDPKVIVPTGATPFKYVQFRLLEEAGNWIIDEYIDHF